MVSNLISYTYLSQAEQASSLRDWTTGMASFDMILANLKEVKASPKPVAETDSDSSESEEDKKSKSKVRLQCSPAVPLG